MKLLYGPNKYPTVPYDTPIFEIMENFELRSPNDPKMLWGNADLSKMYLNVETVLKIEPKVSQFFFQEWKQIVTFLARARMRLLSVNWLNFSLETNQ